MGVGLWFMGLSQTNRINESRLERFHLLSDIRSEIERRIAVTLTSTEILAHEVESAKGHPDDFNFLAQRILDQIGGINNLQLSPNGIVRSIHPLAGNVEALGHNILGDKQRNAEAIASVGSGLMTLAGPIKLVQGGIAVIARKPVYLWANDVRPVRPSRIQSNQTYSSYQGRAAGGVWDMGIGSRRVIVTGALPAMFVALIGRCGVGRAAGAGGSAPSAAF